MKPDTGRAGIVLAAGHSRHYDDGDVSLASLHGMPVVRWVVDAITPVVDEVLVSCRPDQLDSFERVLHPAVTLVPIATAEQDPVAGLRRSLRETDRLTAVVAAGDEPLVPSALFGHLLDRVEQSSTAGVAMQLHGRLQPTPTAVNVRAAAAAATETAETGGTLADAIGALAPVVIPEHHVRATVDPIRLFTVETQSDLARAGRYLASETTSSRPRPDADDVEADD